MSSFTLQEVSELTASTTLASYWAKLIERIVIENAYNVSENESLLENYTINASRLVRVMKQIYKNGVSWTCNTHERDEDSVHHFVG
jgi:hypothetical protein